MHRWLIDQDSSVSSEMPDGQGVWHYDDEVNICNTIPGSSFFYIYMSLFIYLYIYCEYISPFLYLSLKVCHYCSAAAVVVVFFLFFLSLSLLFLLCVAYGYRSSGSFF